MKNIGDNIKTARKRLGLTQVQLAQKMDMLVGTISRWENGKRAPRDEDKQKLATLLNITVAQLIGETDIPSELQLPSKPIMKLSQSAGRAYRPGEGSLALLGRLVEILPDEYKDMPVTRQKMVRELLSECMRHVYPDLGEEKIKSAKG